MKTIGILITSHNRKNKTLKCLKSIYKATVNLPIDFSIKIYLTDDGSSDGTSEAIINRFPEVVLLYGSGDLFWAGGMRNSWKEALKDDHIGYLLLNDDTILFDNIFKDIIETEIFSIKHFEQKGIIIGSTLCAETKEITYGGSTLSNKFLLKFEKKIPTGKPQLCDLGNANIMYVSSEIVSKIGILNEKYKHGVADYDYTLTAKKKNIPVLITPNFCGLCTNDNKDKNVVLKNKTLIDRIKYLYAPNGLAFRDNLLFMKRNFFYRLPFVFISGWFKVFFPSIYKTR